MLTDLDRVADAVIGCALQADAEGALLLMRDLDPIAMRRLAVRLAGCAADSMTERAADAGLDPQEALRLWQAVLLAQQDDDHPPGDAP
jgi:hypothetical protein